MGVDHTFQHINNFGGALGFGIVMGLALLPALFLAGIQPSKSSLFLLVATAILVCVCIALWAQKLDLTFHPSPEHLRVVGYIIAATALAVIVAEIVRRAPEAALFSCLAMILGCGLFGALWMFAPRENLILLVFIVTLLTFGAIAAIAMWAIDRRHARETPPHYAEVKPHLPEVAYIDRGQLAPPPKRLTRPQGRNLPAKRYGGGNG
jgi:hypothetical protein